MLPLQRTKKCWWGKDGLPVPVLRFCDGQLSSYFFSISDKEVSKNAKF